MQIKNIDQAIALYELLDLGQNLVHATSNTPAGLFAYAEGMMNHLIKEFPEISGSKRSAEASKAQEWFLRHRREEIKNENNYP